MTKSSPDISVKQRNSSKRHLWLTTLEASPVQAVSDLLGGYGNIPYTRADAPDAARMLVGHLPADDPARKAMATGLFSWLEKKRVEPLPADPAQLYDLAYQVSEAFETIYELKLVELVAKLSDPTWLEWAEKLNSRNAHVKYLRLISLTTST